MKEKIKDYFLRFSDKEVAVEALEDIEAVSSEAIKDIYYLGIVFRPTGLTLVDKEGNEYPEEEPVEGYHVNLRAALMPAQEAMLPIIPEPKNPRVIFAGGILR